MSYFIVNKDTGKKFRKNCFDVRFDTAKGAKTSLTRMNKKFPAGINVWVVMSYDEHAAAFPVKMVERTNLMSGQTYMEAEGTPSCCSPASETYWSM